MLNQTLPTEFKKLFFLQFTKELILNSTTPETIEIIFQKETKEKIKEAVSHEKLEKSSLAELPMKMKTSFMPMIMQRRIPPVLRIPEPNLPPQFQYLKPFPRQVEINLGKLNPLLQDPLVKEIECNGPDEYIVVHLAVGRKTTDIILNSDEINDIIMRFSGATRIPVHTGVYRVVYGRLIFAAIVSDIIGSKFLIKKMKLPDYSPSMQNQPAYQKSVFPNY